MSNDRRDDPTDPSPSDPYATPAEKEYSTLQVIVGVGAVLVIGLLLVPIYSFLQVHVSRTSLRVAMPIVLGMCIGAASVVILRKLEVSKDWLIAIVGLLVACLAYLVHRPIWIYFLFQSIGEPVDLGALTDPQWLFRTIELIYERGTFTPFRGETETVSGRNLGWIWIAEFLLTIFPASGAVYAVNNRDRLQSQQ